MNTKLLLENLPQFSSSPSRVEYLRKLIYKLATSGKLSHQKSTEEKPNFKTAVGEREIPDTWIWCELQEIANYGGRGSIKPEFIPEDSWLLDLEDIEKTSSKLLVRTRAKDRRTTSNKAIFREGDVLYGKLRPYLDKVLVADMSGYCTTEIVAIQPHDGIDPNWLRICLKRPEFITKVTDLSYGTKMPRLGTEDAKTSIHPVPPLEEQKRIVAEVEQLLALCDQIENAHSFAQTISISTGKSAVDSLSVAQTPEEILIAWQRIQSNWDLIANTPSSIESLKGLILDLAVTGRLTRSNSRSIHTLTRDEALSEIPWSSFAPKDWNLTTLGDACLKISDGTHKTPKYQDSGVPFLSIKDISSGMIDFSKTRFISESEHEELCKRIKPSRGDVLFCRIGTLGKAITVETDREFSIFVSLGLLRPKPYLNPKFLELALNSPISHKQFESIKAGGSHTQKLNLGAMGKYIIWYPDPETQSEIIQQVSDLMALCDQLESNIKIMEGLSEKFVQSVVFSTT